MVTVSLSVYNDATLLRGCLMSVLELLPDADIQVVDGRYESWPEGPDNSTDATREIALDYGASYHDDGPFEREHDKHHHRVDLAPDGDRCLLLDADERLVTCDLDALDDETAYQPRIFNPRVYNQTPIRYWPRIFYPETVVDIPRWDKYRFSTPCERTDAVTIAHRHDLRGRDYREAKYERFQNEGRAGRYDDGRIEEYLDNAFDVETEECPACGRDSLVHSDPTNIRPDGVFTRVAVCIAGDGCYRASEPVELGPHRYLPNRVLKGYQQDPDRLRLEVLDVGVPFVPENCSPGMFRRLAPVLMNWAEANLQERDASLAE